MKKYVTLIIAMSIMLSAQAQTLNSIFDNAIRNGRNNNGKGCYSAQFGNKSVFDGEVRQFMRQKRYISTERFSHRETLRFGTYVSVVSKVDFIKESQLESFIAKVPESSTMGKAVIYPNNKKETVDVYWSGNVKEGWITGNGIGYTKSNNNMYVITGQFENGISTGNCAVVTATPVISNNHLVRTEQKSTQYTVGNSSNGFRSVFMNGRYGFIDSQGNIIASCRYGKIVQEFNSAGYAIVTDPSDGDQEIKINTSGTKLGYSDKQLKINEEKRLAKIAEEKRIAEENKRKEEERRQKDRERALAEARAEEIRQERIRNAKEGDKIYYQKDYQWERGIWIFTKTVYDSMKVVCFVEKNVDNGERLQVRIVSVESTNDFYSTPEIDGIKYSKGDLIWIFPLRDRNWHL